MVAIVSPLLAKERSTMHTGTLDTALLEILVCPVTKARLTYDEAAQELVSPAAGLAYPIRDGIPIMLPEEARKM
jgi:hypothetical protein